MTRQTKTTWIAAATMAVAALGAAAQTLPVATMPPAATTQAALPPGHPSLDQLMGATATAPLAATGTLTIQALAGSAGAALPANEPITVELYHRGTSVKKIETKLDGEGKVVVPEIPITPPVQALVSIKHGGLLQQVVCPELNAQQPNQSIQMKVFETTDEAPAWNIAMQHMIVQWSEDGSEARIIEMLSANTPGDRAWLGAKVAGTEGKEQRITMTVPLPPTADQVELGGNFDEDASHIVGDNLVTGSALFPGRSEFRLTYTVPAKDGAVKLPIVTPAAVTDLIVFLPADDAKVTATGLTGGDAVDMGEGKIRMFRAQNLAAGATATLTITGIKPAPKTADAGMPPTASQFSPRNLAIGGAFLLVLVGAAMTMMKKPQPKKA